jgi:PAS domain S-box-containing protein
MSEINAMTDPVLTRAFTNLVDITNDLVGVADADGRILYLNPSGRRMIGILLRADVSHLHIHDIFPEWSVGAFIREGMVDHLHNVSTRRDATLLAADGRRIPTSLSVVVHLGGEYHVDHFSLFARDVSDQRRIEKAWDSVEKRLEEFFRMRTISKVTVGLAANLDSALTRIGGNIGDALRTVKGEDARRCLNGAVTAVNDARQAIRRMISATTPNTNGCEPVPVLSAVQEAVTVARSSMPATVVIREDFDTDCGTVATDPIQIHQIMMSLFLNARNAVEHGGGVIDVRLDTLEVGNPSKAGEQRDKPCRYARITVSDSGPGMDPESLSFVFEPHLREQTTLNETVLSLTIVNKIVDRCGGAVTIHNRYGRGTSYQVYLPLCDEDTPSLAP